MQNRKLKNRLKGVLVIILAIFICYIYFLTVETGIVKGANETVDTRISSIKNTEEAKKTIEGSIVDRDQEPITQAEEAGVPAVCIYPEAYSSIVGYRSAVYGTSGLRKLYYEQLMLGNKDNKGATISLTTDNAFQQFCYDLIGKNVGSITVMDNKSGCILAMASRSDNDVIYDVNTIDDSFKTYQNIDEFFYNRAVLAQDPPGSTFKIVTAAALIEQGKEDYCYEDEGDYNGIKNAGSVKYGNLNLQDALIYSSNTYFASAGNLLGGSTLENQSRKFFLGEPLTLDFGVLTSNLDFEYYQSPIVAQTAFGQGKTMISPLQIAMIMQGIVNKGEILKPYLISSIVDDGKIEYEGKKEVLGKVVEENTSKKIKNLLNQVAIRYSFEEEYGIIYAKTGMAQVSSGDYNHIYLVFANEEITGIISKDKSYEGSHSLVASAKEILNYWNLM